MQTNANSRQVAGSHYQAVYQHWDMVADLRIGYFEGQVTKYLARWRKKNGLQDLMKAQHFLQKLLELATVNGWGPRGSASGGYSGITTDGRAVPAVNLVAHMLMSNGVDLRSGSIIDMVARWHTAGDLVRAKQELDALVEYVAAAEPGPGYTNQDR